MGADAWVRNETTLCRLLLGSMSLVALLAVAQPASAATIRVPQDQPTIQQAENVAQPGDLIKIRRGTYDENVVVNVSNLRFLGVDGRVIVDADGSGTHVFEITADNVTLQSLTLRNGENDGVECLGQGCTMRSIGVDGDTTFNCIDLGNGNNHVVENSRLVGCGDDGVEASGDGVRIRNTSARLVAGECFQVSGDNALLQRNLAQNCDGGAGIDVAGDGPRIDANKIRLVDGVGINLGTTQNPVVTRNLIQSVKLAGIGFECAVTCGSGLVQRNLVAGVLDDGRGFAIDVAAPGLGTLRILNNTASRTGGPGFEFNIFDALIRGNLASRSGEGIELDGNSDNNQVINNVAVQNRFDGFVIDDDSDNNVLRNNLAERNQTRGFGLVDGNSDDNLLDSNTARNNRGDGIFNNATATDLTNNKSVGSGGTDCVNIGTVDLNTGNKCADGSSF